MSKKLKISEEELIRLIEQAVQDRLDIPTELLPDMLPLDGQDEMEGEMEDEMEDERFEEILSPEEIVGLMEEQIVQLQDRAQYTEELLADVLEFTETLVGELSESPDLKLNKSSQKLRALQTRAGREIFWLKSRRL
tara:strand:- start:94 stop:501 length:408 start_codon:yes stop_codon:yes gene_type:complete